jgi:PAS domain S-box-containing protein
MNGLGRTSTDAAKDLSAPGPAAQDRSDIDLERYRLAAIVDSSDDAIIGLTLDGRIETWNPGAEKLFGYSLEEVRGLPSMILVPADNSTVVESLLEQIRSGERVQNYESTRVRKDGGRVDVSLNISPIRDGAGRLVGASVIARDIAESKKARLALERARQELEQRVAERTAELKQLNEKLGQNVAEQIRINGQLQAEVKTRRRLEQRVLQVSEREQRRIGQDMHDGLGQHLTGVACLSKALQRKLEAAGSSLGVGECLQLVELVDEAIQQTRDLARGLYPAELETHGLLASLTTFAATARQMYDTSCRVVYGPPLPEPDLRTSIQLYRIAQEAVSNALKHGRAKNIVISLRPQEAGFELSIEDDGAGIAEGAERSGGMGLAIMRYRAESIGAQLEVKKKEETGTVVLCRVRFHTENNAGN